MSWFNRILSNVLSGERRLASAVVPRSIQRGFADLGNWITGYVKVDQTPRVFNEIAEHVRANYPPLTPTPLSVPQPPRQRSIINPSQRPTLDQFAYRLDVSGLRGFANVYTIDGNKSSLIPPFFLRRTRYNITKILGENRRTNVILILAGG